MIPAFDNPQGHWESQLIADFNDEILTLANSHWGDWLPVNPSLFEFEVWQQLVDRGRELLRVEFGDEHLFVLKDPRICRLAGFWQEVMAAEGIDAAIVIPLRNPIEVAQSLAARNGIDEYQSLLIWLRHVLAAEAMTRGKARVFTEYSALLENWELVAARVAGCLNIEWPCVSPMSAWEISQYLSLDLRHHIGETTALTENPAISPWIYRAYRVLIGWAQTGESATDYPILDGLMEAFNDAGIAFAQPMLRGVQAAQCAAQLRAERTTAVEQRGEVEFRLAVASAELDTATAQVGILSEKLVAAIAEMHQFERRTMIVESSLRQGKEKVAETDAKLLQARENVKALKAELQHLKHVSEDQQQQLSQKLAIENTKTKWLQMVIALRDNRPWWWAMMPRKWLQERDNQRLMRMGLFDATAYLKRNPDVAASGMNPLLHYMLHGIDEDRG
jgi:hypothetical protein